MTPTAEPVHLSLVLPCFNEAQHIERSVPEIVRVLEACRWSYEIIFVDDASQDDTRDLIQRLIAHYPEQRMSCIFHERNIGRGGAVRDGFYAASGERLGYIDIDLEVPPHYIPPCLLALEAGADVCVARRIYRLRPDNLFRHVLSRGYALWARRLLGWPYTDTESGFKFLWRPAALDLLRYTESRSWFWDTEIMFYAHRLGYKVTEVPCLYLRRADKASTVRPIADSFAYGRSLIRLAWRLHSGHAIRAHARVAEIIPDD